MNDVVKNKVAGIQRCVKRAREELTLAGDAFTSDFTQQDAAILNVTRACELAIDLANHTIKIHKLGLPKDSHDTFQLLFVANIISNESCASMKKMVGFRNLAVHQYEELNMDVVAVVIRNDLDDLPRFGDALLKIDESD